MQLTLYHGTNCTAARQILRDNVYKARSKDIHYLGQGIYFYDNDNKAEKWIKRFYKGNGIILVNEISVADEDVFDMRKPSDKRKAIEIAKNLSNEFILAGKDIDFIEYAKKLRCFLYDIISKESNCKLLISIVQPNIILWQLSFPDNSDLQYCVKDPSIITKIVFFRKIIGNRVGGNIA